MLVGLAVVGWLARRWWEPRLAARGLALRDLPVKWWLVGYPQTAARIVFTWRRLCQVANLAVSLRASHQRVLGKDTVVEGRALRPSVPRLSWPMPTRHGLKVRVVMLPGQTPAPYYAAARAMEHAWRVHSVMVTSPRRGHVLLTITAADPLTGELPAAERAGELLAADVGWCEEGVAFVIDFRRTPHWMITGATQSGKSTLLAALVRALAPQPVALVGVDCKGGMEFSGFGRRLTLLATSRRDAIEVLERLVREIQARTQVCRAAGARSVWDLPEKARPVPLVLLVDEIAELYLTDGSRSEREAAERCGTLLLRIAQLGAALGVYLVAAGQRVGSDLGVRVTSLRAQLGGRVAHRAHDEASAEMTLGDINKDAVVVAQSITEDEQGVCVVAMQGRWTRARSHLISQEERAEIAATDPPRSPFLSGMDSAPAKGGQRE
ncbi:FtsK/SpoIIIE domain-containing protein [Streptomyces spectabilis]|uniref:FtsK/SpoIIIE domain-containing protein n=1 Tax=Streptomyces spectabilis TaxID=68270 RepID=UPI0033F04025